MTKLCQIIAVEQGVRKDTKTQETALYHDLAKTQLLEGLARTYTPNTEEPEPGDLLPDESVQVQINSEDVLTELTKTLIRRIDIVATKDEANTKARADIVVGRTTVASQVPVTTLIFLEKELEDLAALVNRLPQLNPATTWTESEPGIYKTPPVETVRTKKVPKNHIKYEATEHHPAQVEMFTEDLIVGRWRKIEYSGAMPAERIADIKSRLAELRIAVKYAREEANSIEVTDVEIAAGILNFLFNEGGAQVSG